MLRDDREEALLHPTADAITQLALVRRQEFFEVVEIRGFERGHGDSADCRASALACYRFPRGRSACPTILFVRRENRRSQKSRRPTWQWRAFRERFARSKTSRSKRDCAGGFDLDFSAR